MRNANVFNAPKIRDWETKIHIHLVVRILIIENLNPTNEAQLPIYRKKFELFFSQ